MRGWGLGPGGSKKIFSRIATTIKNHFKVHVLTILTYLYFVELAPRGKIRQVQPVNLIVITFFDHFRKFAFHLSALACYKISPHFSFVWLNAKLKGDTYATK